MFENAEWLFFDLGSTLIDEHIAYEHRLKEIADQANVSYEEVCRIAVGFYKQNKKGDLETAKLFGVELPSCWAYIRCGSSRDLESIGGLKRKLKKPIVRLTA